MQIDEALKRRVCGVWPVRGPAWLEALPDLVEEISERWGVRVGEAYPLSYNVVLRAVRRDGVRCVLKLGVPCAEFTREVHALEMLRSPRCVEVFESDVERGLLLLEQLRPGVQLSSLEDSHDAARIAAKLTKSLPRVFEGDTSRGFPTVAQWAGALQRPVAQRIPEASYTRALRSIEWLETTREEPNCVLHGDFHHGNILFCSSRGAWTVIDPKGIFAERAFAFGSFLANHTRHYACASSHTALLKCTIEILCEELQLDPRRVCAATYVYGVLSALWSIEDNESGWEHTLRFADSVHTLQF